MKLNFRKGIALLICICFVFSFCFNSVMASNNDKVDKSKVKIVQNDDKVCTVMATYKGDALYATINKETNEITMQAVEKPKANAFGLSLGKDKKTNYKVKVQDAKDGKVSAIVTGLDSNKEYKVGTSDDKVIAQIPLAVPLIVILGEILLDVLLGTIATIVVAGVTYYAASKVISKIRSQTQYDYFQAALSGGTLYVGGGINYAAALSATEIGGDTFARTSDKARILATAAGAGYRGPECHGNEGYYYHYHPKYGSLAQYAHCFY